jgi:hypothetical protein
VGAAARDAIANKRFYSAAAILPATIGSSSKERDPWELAAYRDCRIQASEAKIAQALDDVVAAMTVISEVGCDMSKWKTENHFVSWLKLSPDNKISGGKIIGNGRMPTNNRAAIVLRMAATSLRESDSYLGAQFRRFCGLG